MLVNSVPLVEGGWRRTSRTDLCLGVVPVVEVNDLQKSFGGTRALAGMTWSAHTGRVTAILGPNGAGKSTTIECLQGLQRPDGGTARVLGIDPWGAPAEHRARVGLMLQDGGLPGTVKPLPLLTHLRSMYAAPADLDALVDRLGIGSFAGTVVRRLSGGQRQRVALAAALVGAPDVVFLDEPTSGMDPHTRLEVWALIRELAARGVTVIVATHSFDEAQRIADDVVIVDAGRARTAGPLDEVVGAATLESVYFGLTRGAR